MWQSTCRFRDRNTHPLVRPHVEYCSTVWDPPTAHLTRKVEMVQRRSARWVCNKYRTGLNTTGPTEMIRTLDWPSLESRRKVARLCLLFKMRNNLVRMSYRTLLEPYPYRTKAMALPCSITSWQNSQETILCQQFLPPHSLRLELTPPQCSHCSIHWGLQGLSDVSSGLEVQTDDFNLHPLFSPLTLSYNPILRHSVYSLHLAFSLHSYILSLLAPRTSSSLIILETPRFQLSYRSRSGSRLHYLR